MLNSAEPVALAAVEVLLTKMVGPPMVRAPIVVLWPLRLSKAIWLATTLPIVTLVPLGSVPLGPTSNVPSLTLVWLP